MAIVELIYDVKPLTYIAANPTKVLSNGEPIYYTNGQYSIGDGTTQLSSLPLYGGTGYTFTGTTSQYTRGDGTYATFPTNVSSFTNDSGYITSSALSPYLTIANAALTYQPIGSYLTGLTVGSTAIGSGTNTRILYNNAGVLGEYTVTGTGTTAVLSTSPTFTTDITTPVINGVLGALNINTNTFLGANYLHTSRVLGGTSAGDNLDLFSTSGNGTGSGKAITFRGGNNGSVTILSMLNDGTIRIPNNRVIQGTDSAGTNRSLLTWSASDNITINGRPGVSDILLNPTSGGVGLYVKSNGDAGIGVVSPSARWHIIKTTEQFRIGYDASNYISETVSSLGNITYNNVTSTQTAATNLPNYRWNGITKTWAAGTVANQYWNYFTANTAAFASASTITNSYGLYVEAATAGANATITNNYALGLSGDLSLEGGNRIIRGSNSIEIIHGTGSNYRVYTGSTLRVDRNPTYVSYYNGTATSGSVVGYLFTSSSNTGQTASAEIPSFKLVNGTRTWAAGAITTQREFYITSPTYAFASPSTITNSYGLYVEAPIAGTNATINNNWSLGTNGNLLCQGSLVSSSPSGGVGYFIGAGSTVTQITSRTTGVTINNVCGAITLVSAAGTTTWQSFTVTNSRVTATDVIIVNQGTGTDLYQIFVTNVAAGSFQITFATTGGTTTEQPVFNFSIIKAVTA